MNTEISYCRVLPLEQLISLSENHSLLEGLKEARILLKSSCGGHGSCGDCVVKILEGREGLPPLSLSEQRLLGNVTHITKERLACQLKMSPSITIDISSHLTNKSPLEGQSAPKTVLKKSHDLKKTEQGARKSQDSLQAESHPDWYRHWEKKGLGTSGEDIKEKKGQSGHRRPRPFRFSVEDKSKKESGEE